MYFEFLPAKSRPETKRSSRSDDGWVINVTPSFSVRRQSEGALHELP